MNDITQLGKLWAFRLLGLLLGIGIMWAMTESGVAGLTTPKVMGAIFVVLLFGLMLWSRIRNGRWW